MKMTTYKIIAKAHKKGRAVACSRCGREWHCTPRKDYAGITCGYCIMGLADGVPEDMIPKQPKKLRLNISKGRVA